MTEVLVLTRSDVELLLDPDNCLTVVEEAFRQYGAGEIPSPGALGVRAPGGGFHIKAGILGGKTSLFATKVNGNFFENEKHGLPRIQGVIVVSDAETGAPLAVMDSIAITRLRTAAATAVAANHLAPTRLEGAHDLRMRRPRTSATPRRGARASGQDRLLLR